MKFSQFIFRTAIILMVLLMVSCSSKSTEDIVLMNLNIVDVKSGEIAINKNLYIRDERIVKIEPYEGNRDSNPNEIDCTGKFVIPALWDMHTHTTSFDWVPKLLIANGVLGIREADGDGQLSHLEQRKNGVYNGIEFYCAGNTIEGDGPHGFAGELNSIYSPEEAIMEVRRQKALGFDFIKTRLGLSRETFFAIARESQKLDMPLMAHLPLSVTHEEAIKAGVASIEHTVGLQEAIPKKHELAQLINDRDSTFFNEEAVFNVPKYYDYVLNSLDANLYDEIPEITSSGTTWFCPTLVMWRGWAKGDSISFHPEKNKYIPKEVLREWNTPVDSSETDEILFQEGQYEDVAMKMFTEILEVIKPMKDAGTRFLSGTDYIIPFIYPGYDLHDELQLFVAAGFSPLEALQTATINPAIFLNRSEDFGSVEEGKIANLILLDRNPLINIENTESINMVIQHGNIYSQEDIKNLLESINN